jgi:tetratricopeptide (TPR) repeat protein
MLPPFHCVLERKGEVAKLGVEYQVAEEIYCQMLKSFEGNHNPTQPSILCGLHNLGVVLTIYGKLEAAEKTFLRILEEIGGSLRPEDSMTMARALNSLAVVKYLQDKYHEAEILLRKTLHSQEQGLDSDQVLSLCSYNNLAMILRDLNQAKMALDLQERVVEKARYWYAIGDCRFNRFQQNLEWIQR